MKNAWILGLTLISSLASAQNVVLNPFSIKPTASLYEAKIQSVNAEVIGQGDVAQHVTVQATFGNSCSVPKAEELVVGVGYRESYAALSLSLYSKSARICPMNYSPVTITIDLGTFVRPNDGLFQMITVNGIEAK